MSKEIAKCRDVRKKKKSQRSKVRTRTLSEINVFTKILRHDRMLESEESILPFFLLVFRMFVLCEKEIREGRWIERGGGRGEGRKGVERGRGEGGRDERERRERVGSSRERK